MTFAEAAELLARRYGIAPRTSDGGVRQRQKERLLALHEQAAELFQGWLKQPPARRPASTCTRVGPHRRDAAEFRIGYAPPTWETLLPAMAQRGFSAQGAGWPRAWWWPKEGGTTTGSGIASSSPSGTQAGG